MKKTLKFAAHLVPLILSGEKTSTWRLFDDKDLTEGDIVDFIDRGSGGNFITAKLIKIIEKPLGSLTLEDKGGHEVYENDEQMYETFKNYYQKEVTPETLVKVVFFELT